MPPTGAAKQHPTPTAQAGTRRSSCPGTVCNREARRTRRVAGWGRQAIGSRTRIGNEDKQKGRKAQERKVEGR